MRTKLPFILVAAMIVVLTVASFAEPIVGSDGVRRMAYGTWWFRALWAALAVSGVWACVRHKMWRRPAVAMLHLSFVVILAGALTTALTATEGSIMLYEGEQTDMFLTKDRRVAHMDFALRLDSFRIERYADSGAPSDYRSHISILDPDSSTGQLSRADDTATISMNHILRHRRLRFYQSSYTPDERGTILTVVHDPYGISLTYAGYALLLLSAVLILLPRRLKRPSTAAMAVGAVTLVGTLAYTLRWTHSDHLLPVLRSPLLGVHIGVIIVAYMLFLLMALMAVWNKVAHHPLPLRPARLLLPAVLALSVGIFVGAVWANISWGSYWTWDPKEVWALITLLVYCLPLHRRSLPWFAARRSVSGGEPSDERHVESYLIFAFATVLITYFGVNLVLGGMHSYAN